MREQVERAHAYANTEARRARREAEVAPALVPFGRLCWTAEHLQPAPAASAASAASAPRSARAAERPGFAVRRADDRAVRAAVAHAPWQPLSARSERAVAEVSSSVLRLSQPRGGSCG